LLCRAESLRRRPRIYMYIYSPYTPDFATPHTFERCTIIIINRRRRRRRRRLPLAPSFKRQPGFYRTILFYSLLLSSDRIRVVCFCPSLLYDTAASGVARPSRPNSGRRRRTNGRTANEVFNDVSTGDLSTVRGAASRGWRAEWLSLPRASRNRLTRLRFCFRTEYKRKTDNLYVRDQVQLRLYSVLYIIVYCEQKFICPNTSEHQMTPTERGRTRFRNIVNRIRMDPRSSSGTNEHTFRRKTSYKNQ